MKQKKTNEFKNFNKVMDGLLAVSHKELQEKLEEEKQNKVKQNERQTISSASRASSNSKK